MSFIRQLSRIKDIVKEKHATGVKDVGTRRAMDRLYDDINKMRKMLENVPDGETTRSDTVGNKGSTRMVFDGTDSEYVPEFKTPDGWSRGAMQTITDAKGGLVTPPSLSSSLGNIPTFFITDKSENDFPPWLYAGAIDVTALAIPSWVALGIFLDCDGSDVCNLC